MPWRAALLTNWGWKVFSLVLASLIWITVRTTNPPETGLQVAPPARTTRLFERLPITVMTAAADLRNFRVTPAEVNVVLAGDYNVLRDLKQTELEVYVNLVDVKDARSLRKRIQATPPAGTTLVRISPAYVEIEMVTPGR